MAVVGRTYAGAPVRRKAKALCFTMLLAITKDKTRIKPTKDVEAECPVCNNSVVAKMGLKKMHHWAHKPGSNCTYGKGMTEWHYRWIDRHYEKSGWEVEYVNGSRRYDCFNADKGLVLEIQKAPAYEYIIDKTKEIVGQGYKLNWIIHQEMMSALDFKEGFFEAKNRRRLVVLDVLHELSDIPEVAFYVDMLAVKSNGKSSKGLLKLHPTSRSRASYSDYYHVKYSDFNPKT